MLSQRKLSGAVDYATSYKKEWEQTYPISPGGTATEFWCNVCLCNASCSQGEEDVKHHCDGENHINPKKELENTRSLSSFGFTKATDPLCEKVFCRGSDSRLGKCTKRSVKLFKFQRNLWSENFTMCIFLSSYYLVI